MADSAFLKLLKKEFQRKQKVNSRYSMRALARTLGISPGSISEIFSGQRVPSVKLASRCLKALGADSAQARDVVDSMKKQKKTPAPERQYVVSEGFGRYLLQWPVPAVFPFLRNQKKSVPLKDITESLGLNKAEVEVVKAALKAFEAAKVLSLSDTFEIKTFDHFDSMVFSKIADIDAQLISDHHKVALARAQVIVGQTSPSERECMTSYLALSQKDFEDLSVELRQVLRRFALKAGSQTSWTTPRRVYQVSSQAVPLSATIHDES